MIPVISLALHASGGFKDCAWGEIQSSTAPFKLFVSSDRVFEHPSVSVWVVSSGTKTRRGNRKHQLGNMDDPFVGAFHQTLLKSRNYLKEELEFAVLPPLPVLCPSQSTFWVRATYSCVNMSSSCSASSPIRRMPLFRRAFTIHKAWTVHPKCLPWCTSGSVTRLAATS